MKKHLLMFASWAMLMFGAASFTSCGDDDDDNTPAVTNNDNLSASQIYNKYKDKKGASIEGNDVVFTITAEGYTTVGIITYSGDNISGGKSYIDCKTSEAAKAFAEDYKADGTYVEIDGTIVITKMSNEDIEEYKGLPKESLVAVLNLANSIIEED